MAERTAAVRRPPPRRGTYVYGVIQSARRLRFGAIGIGTPPGEVYTVHFEALAAVVSATALEAIDPSRQNVLAHDGVNRTVMRGHTVLPMSFGAVFRTEEDVVELLHAAAGPFADALAKLRNKVEVGLKALCDVKAMIREIERDRHLRRLKAEIARQKGSVFLARIEYGRLVDAALAERRRRYAREIFEQLGPVSVAARPARPIGGKMMVNAAFLVRRAQKAAFDAAVKRLLARYRELTFNYTGPWPPYHFVDIHLKLEPTRGMR